jgi:hypothetical protein
VDPVRHLSQSPQNQLLQSASEAELVGLALAPPVGEAAYH